MKTNSILNTLQPGCILETGAKDQFNILLWTSLASRILGLPSQDNNG